MDATTYAAISRRVAETFVAAYAGYVRRRLAAVGAEGPTLEAAIAQGQASLAASFASWREASPASQRTSPLELFREALVPPTAAAIARGISPPDRDDAQEQALPGDLLDLAPATSRDLGDEAWEAHVAWGLARAEAIAGMVPRSSEAAVAGVRVALVGTDLMDRTRIGDLVSAAGYELLVWRNPAAVFAGLAEAAPAIALVDLSHPAANEAIERLATAGVRTIAFGPHVDDLAMAAARALGADDVLARSRFFARLPSLLPRPT